MPHFALMPSDATTNALTVAEQDARDLAAMPVLPDPDPFLYFNPTQELQERYVGRSFEPSYLEGRVFINYVLEKAIQPDTPQRVLDFGCGWGRMSRILSRATGSALIERHGCDVSTVALDVVRRSMPSFWTQKTNYFPPSTYRDGLFDVIFAYSVFSHLSEDSARAWGQEFARILAPGGRLVVTTQGLRFLGWVDDLRSGVAENRNPWHDLLIASDLGMALKDRYEAGEFIYAATQASTKDYGEAAAPRSWFESVWGGFGFEMADWDESQGQNRCVMVLRG